MSPASSLVAVTDVEWSSRCASGRVDVVAGCVCGCRAGRGAERLQVVLAGLEVLVRDVTFDWGQASLLFRPLDRPAILALRPVVPDISQSHGGTLAFAQRWASSESEMARSSQSAVSHIAISIGSNTPKTLV